MAARVYVRGSDGKAQRPSGYPFWRDHFVCDGRVTLSVSNSGPAISAIDRGRIFDRFYRGAHSANIPGTGLGLAIVQRIVQAHGGEATVTSDAATGTTFTLSLPASSHDDELAHVSSQLSV